MLVVVSRRGGEGQELDEKDSETEIKVPPWLVEFREW
jgi:hypothetical protein